MLFRSANFVQTVEDRQGMMISCPEEIAYRMGFIDTHQLLQQAERYRGNQYGEYLMRLCKEDIPFHQRDS